MNANKPRLGKAMLTQTVVAGSLLAAACWSMAGTDGTADRRFDHRTALTPSHLTDNASRVPDVAHVPWYGATYAAWTQRFWQWYTSIPLAVGPSTDPDGTQCGINQEGPVWFLAGPLGSTFERSCTIPYGKAILSPVVGFLNDYPCSESPAFQPGPGQTLEDFLRTGVAGFIDAVTQSQAALDGKALRVHRVATQLFAFTAAADSVALDPCITGSPQLGVSDGYFLFIKPLSPGEHTLSIHSTITLPGSPPTITDATYHLTITK